MSKETVKNNIINIVISIVGVGLIAAASSLLTNPNSAWFVGLTKPTEVVPNWFFPIIWSVIYILSAVVIYLLLHSKTLSNKLLVLFCVNGLLNVIWCLTFFTLNWLLIGLIVLIFNLVFAILLLLELYKLKPLYGYLLCIYGFWLMVANASNLALWILN